MLGFNIEDAQALQHQMETFLIETESDWRSIVVQWEMLKECWNDNQYDHFMRFFDGLARSYQIAIAEVHEYSSFLKKIISEVEKVPHTEFGEVEELKWERHGAGDLKKSKVSQLPDNLKGVYYIHDPNILASEDSEITYYVGKSDSCIKGRLLSHLNKSSNRKLRKAVALDQPLLFYWHESPRPTYEEALEIGRLKSKGMLIGQRREKKVLIEKLDFD